ncbi:hypothetical protein ACS0TY_033044 [Phlomoides rotata]
MIKINSRALKLEGCLPVDCEGNGRERRGGLCLLWRAECDITLKSFSTNHITVDIADRGRDRRWQCTGIYGWPMKHHRNNTFTLLRTVAPTPGTPWLCMGDLNEILWSREKQGGRRGIT